MARIAGVNIPNQKRVPIGLTYIHGIGRTKATEICSRVGIPTERRVHEMTDDEVLRVRAFVWVRWPRTGNPLRCRSPR